MKINKENFKRLAKSYREEQAKKNPDSDIKHLGIWKMLTFAWWCVFKKRRAIFFMHLMDKGMSHFSAFNYAKKANKDEVDGVLYVKDYLK